MTASKVSWPPFLNSVVLGRALRLLLTGHRKTFVTGYWLPSTCRRTGSSMRQGHGGEWWLALTTGSLLLPPLPRTRRPLLPSNQLSFNLEIFNNSLKGSGSPKVHRLSFRLHQVYLAISALGGLESKAGVDRAETVAAWRENGGASGVWRILKLMKWWMCKEKLVRREEASKSSLCDYENTPLFLRFVWNINLRHNE